MKYANLAKLRLRRIVSNPAYDRGTLPARLPFQPRDGAAKAVCGAYEWYGRIQGPRPNPFSHLDENPLFCAARPIHLFGLTNS